MRSKGAPLSTVGAGLSEVLPYWRGGGIDTRWLVLTAPPAFFRITKRLHNLLHGLPEPLPDARGESFFDDVSREAGALARARVKAGDIVVLEDPQVAGLAPELIDSGALVIWRSHVGTEEHNEHVDAAWGFLAPRISGAVAFVFSRADYVPAFLAESSYVIAPAIDPLSAKNQSLTSAQVEAILRMAGLADGRLDPARASAVLADGRRVDVHSRVSVLREGRPARLATEPLVVALARWDRLKDPIGILEAFARHVEHPTARLMIAGAAPGAVADDPDENALIVNALQRQAAVVVKKSLREGFGRGVTEGLWKARPVIATDVGGHKDQIEDGRTGVLLEDPSDLAGACPRAVPGRRPFRRLDRGSREDLAGGGRAGRAAGGRSMAVSQTAGAAASPSTACSWARFSTPSLLNTLPRW